MGWRVINTVWWDRKWLPFLVRSPWLFVMLCYGFRSSDARWERSGTQATSEPVRSLWYYTRSPPAAKTIPGLTSLLFYTLLYFALLVPFAFVTLPLLYLTLLDSTVFHSFALQHWPYFIFLLHYTLHTLQYSTLLQFCFLLFASRYSSFTLLYFYLLYALRFIQPHTLYFTLTPLHSTLLYFTLRYFRPADVLHFTLFYTALHFISLQFTLLLRLIIRSFWPTLTEWSVDEATTAPPYEHNPVILPIPPVPRSVGWKQT